MERNLCNNQEGKEDQQQKASAKFSLGIRRINLSSTCRQDEAPSQAHRKKTNPAYDLACCKGYGLALL